MARQRSPPEPPSTEGIHHWSALLAGHHDAPSDASHGPITGHPESVERVNVPLARLKKCRLWQSLRRLAWRRASDEELLLAHSQAHVAGLKELARLAASDQKPRFVPPSGPLCLGGPCCEVQEGVDDTDTFVTAGSLEAARGAAGAVLQLVDETVAASTSDDNSGRPACGLALCRPPGHHASHSRSSGFCLVNNVAVAAAYALEKHPEIERVLILDWDVHHGQGTQQIFEQSAQVLVVNVHRHETDFYPGTGGAREVGLGAGRGFTVNVPLPEGYGDAAFWTALVEVVLPAARRFNPHLILVSAGFDAAEGDPLGGCQVTPRMFGAVTRELKKLAAELAQGRFVLALEGGYNPEVLADCIQEVVEALTQDVSGIAEAFAIAPAWLVDVLAGAAACRGAVRRTCEAHHTLPLRIPMPSSKADRRRACSRTSEPSKTEADASQDESSERLEARIKIRSAGQVVVKISPLPLAPKDVAVSEAELRVVLHATAIEEQPQTKHQYSSPKLGNKSESEILHEATLLSTEPAATWTALRRWRFEGVRVDTTGPLRCAEFRPKRRELTLRLALGPILGGAVGLVPVGACA